MVAIVSSSPAPSTRRAASTFFFHVAAAPEIYTLSLRDALPISPTIQASSPASRRIRIASSAAPGGTITRSEEHTSELQSRPQLVCRLLLEKKNRRLPLAVSTAWPGTLTRGWSRSSRPRRHRARAVPPRRFFFMLRRPPRFTLFPYATLFRSRRRSRLPRRPREESGSRRPRRRAGRSRDRKSTRLNSSHVRNSYAVFCLKKKIDVSLSRCPRLGRVP